MIKEDLVPKRNIRIEEGTPGGKTYYVKLPEQKIERALCFRHCMNKQGFRCTKPAGFNTFHTGTGACNIHGGGGKEEKLPGRFTTGKTATMMRKRLDEKVQKYLGDEREKLLDMTYELAVTKIIFQEFLDTYPGIEGDQQKDGMFSTKYETFIKRFTDFISTVSNLVEKMSRVETRNTLTAAQVLYLRATIADILMKYVLDPLDREKAAKELATRMGGDVEVEMNRSEFVLPSKVNINNDGE
jgi:hypothetical protein